MKLVILTSILMIAKVARIPKRFEMYRQPED